MILHNPGFNLTESEFINYTSSQIKLNKALEILTETIGRNATSSDWDVRLAIYSKGRIKKEIDKATEIADFLKWSLALPTDTDKDKLLLVMEQNKKFIKQAYYITRRIATREQNYYDNKTFLRRMLRSKGRKRRIRKAVLFAVICTAAYWFVKLV